MSKEMEIKQECCDIWNNLKDKTKMIDYLIESKQQISDLEQKLALTEKALELACEDKPRPIKYYGNYMGSVNDYIEFYKTKAKEMIDETTK